MVLVPEVRDSGEYTSGLTTRVGTIAVGLCWTATVTPARLYLGCGLGPNYEVALRLDNGDSGTRVWQVGFVYDPTLKTVNAAPAVDLDGLQRGGLVSPGGRPGQFAAERLQVYWGTGVTSERERGLRGETSRPSTSTPSGLPVPLQGEGREYRAYPSLSRARWLLPAGHPEVRRAGIKGLFHPSSLKGRALQASIVAGVLPGRRVSLRGDALVGLEEKVAGALAEREVKVAFYLGMPGAYRKVTAQVMRPNGGTLAFAKIASSPVTQELVEKERRTLLRLSESEVLRGRVPEVLHAFDWEGSRVLLITGGPDRPGPNHLSSAHLDLCKAFFLPFAERTIFGEGAMMARMSETLRNVGPHLPGPLSSWLNRALDCVRGEIGPVRMPLSLCHRDFAPWNTRVGSRGLFVFDWDGAQGGTIPLYDLFHFQAIQAALFNRRDHLPDRSLLHRALDDLWPEGHEYLPWLYLTYLLDMCLFYSEAQVQAPGIGEQRVWRWFGSQIETFLQRDCRL